MDWFTIYCLGKALLFAALWIAVMWAARPIIANER